MSDDAATIAQLRRELARQRRLAEAAYALHTSLDLGELLQIILTSAREGVDADRGTVFLLADGGRALWSRVLAGEKALEIRLPIGQGIAGAVGATGETVRIADAYEDPRFDRSWDQKTGYRTRQILCAPIRSRDGRIVGVFQLLNKLGGGDFGQQDEEFLEALSVPVALAVENARLHLDAIEKERQDKEIALAQNVQRAIQPERLDTTHGRITIAGLNVLCEDASGDYYDVFALPSGRIAVVIGDVSGHGLHCALVMAQARAFLRAYSPGAETLQDVLQALNDFLAADLTAGRFLTFFLALVEPETGQVQWGNAGNLPPLVRRVDGTLFALDATGPVLGILVGVPYREGEPFVLGPGESLLLYTDGATEARAPAGDLFGEHRLRDVVAAHGGLPPREHLDAIVAALLEHTHEDVMGDDLTLVAVRRADEAPGQ
jgi:serine phosphatase RsbU (regulator of sigma subunit)